MHILEIKINSIEYLLQSMAHSTTAPTMNQHKTKTQTLTGHLTRIHYNRILTQRSGADVPIQISLQLIGIRDVQQSLLLGL